MMGIPRRAATMAMLFALSISMLGNATITQAKKAKPVVPKSLSVRVSQSKTLKIKNVSKRKIKKTTWKVSNTKKLKLSKKQKQSVKITGRKTGTVKVKAVVTVGKKKYKLSTKVKILKKKTTTTPTPTPETDSKQPGTVNATATPTQTPVETPPAEKPSETREDIKKMELLPEPKTYQKSVDAPDLLTMLDGTKVTTKEQWENRRQEIRCILQRYMYGIWRDGSEETLRYSVSGKTMTITIQRKDAEASFKADITMPEGTAPEGGWPVVVSVGGFYGSTLTDYMSERGYASISITPTDIASDSTSRKGAFYTLYPYDRKDWKEQTGAVMAWAWGTSKVLDALETGAGKELGISPVNTIVTGISRYGKAAAAAGAFEERFKVSMPVCSGYGGLTMGRYSSNKITYNLLPDFENDPKAEGLGDLSAWKSSGGNEPINSLSGAGWFNEEFKGFSNYQNLPFDAHYIAALSAVEGRYMFMVTGINSDMWNSPPGLWWCYQEAKPAFELMGLSDNLAIQMHLDLHGIEIEDLCKLFTYTDHHFYKKETDSASYPEPWNELLADFTLDDLKTCVFASEANKEAYQEGMPVDASLLPPNPDVTADIKVWFGDQEVTTTVSRNIEGDGLITPLTGDQEGTGFTYKYGWKEQYSKSYTRFDLTLPEGKKLSDYESVTFTCVTDSNYYGKRVALIANPKSIGLPADLDYNYNTAGVTGCINLTGETEFPNNTSSAREITLPIDTWMAEQIEENEIECSIYIHMENVEGNAEYTITNITFNS